MDATHSPPPGVPGARPAGPLPAAYLASLIAALRGLGVDHVSLHGCTPEVLAALRDLGGDCNSAPGGEYDWVDCDCINGPRLGVVGYGQHRPAGCAHLADSDEPADAPDDRDDSPVELSETEAGYRARDRWARRYDELDGAPEGGWDR